jgi:baseplate J-like protein
MGSHQALVPAYILSAVVVVAAALGSLVIMETATVSVSVPASKLIANVTLKGGPQGRDLVTTTLNANVTDSQQGTASTVVTTPAYATGVVLFTCAPCPSEIPVGTVVKTASGTAYQTLVRGPMASSSSSSVSVLVRAMLQGKAGNTAANTVTVIDPAIANTKVQNPQPITGGADASTSHVIQPSDFEQVQSALVARVALDLNASLQAQAEGLNYLVDGQPTFKVDSDHKIGDQVTSFTMTITGSLTATAFSQGKADALMRAALDQKLPRGFKLTSDPLVISYQVQRQPNTSGDVAINGIAIGVVVPSATADELKARIKGLRVDAARHQLEQLAPGTTVDIIVKPAVPWLPVIQDHITVTLDIEPAAA